jgi:hypothetical protein
VKTVLWNEVVFYPTSRSINPVTLSSREEDVFRWIISHFAPEQQLPELALIYPVNRCCYTRGLLLVVSPRTSREVLKKQNKIESACFTKRLIKFQTLCDIDFLEDVPLVIDPVGSSGSSTSLRSLGAYHACESWSRKLGKAAQPSLWFVFDQDYPFFPHWWDIKWNSCSSWVHFTAGKILWDEDHFLYESGGQCYHTLVARWGFITICGNLKGSQRDWKS